jgi:hypothetical protein
MELTSWGAAERQNDSAEPRADERTGHDNIILHVRFYYDSPPSVCNHCLVSPFWWSVGWVSWKREMHDPAENHPAGLMDTHFLFFLFYRVCLSVFLLCYSVLYDLISFMLPLWQPIEARSAMHSMMGPSMEISRCGPRHDPAISKILRTFPS